MTMSSKWFFPTMNEAVRNPYLPDPFRKPESGRIQTADEWPEQRAYIKAMLTHYLYGEMPPGPVCKRCRLVSRREADGQSVAETREASFCGGSKEFSFPFRVLRPEEKRSRIPVVVLIAGADNDCCPIPAELTKSGYAVAAFDREIFAPDSEEYRQGICGRFYPGYSWRAVAMWAWGAGRVLDALEKCDFADPRKVTISGHSRCGKAAFCAGIFDERFAACIPAGSGMGGAGLMRYIGDRFGVRLATAETWGSMTFPGRFQYWFSEEGASFGNHRQDYQMGREEFLPFDLHFLRAAAAPLPLLNLEALDDNLWGNTLGTLISWRAGAEVYRFLNAPDNTAIHFREGGHDFTAEDWRVMLDFLNVKLLNKPKRENWKTPGPNDSLLHCDWKAPEPVQPLSVPDSINSEKS